jgi:hypothetical protein
MLFSSCVCWILGDMSWGVRMQKLGPFPIALLDDKFIFPKYAKMTTIYSIYCKLRFSTRFEGARTFAPLGAFCPHARFSIIKGCSEKVRLCWGIEGVYNAQSQSQTQSLSLSLSPSPPPPSTALVILGGIGLYGAYGMLETVAVSLVDV